MKQLENYQNALQEVYDYFGFKPGYVEAVIDDMTGNVWSIEHGSRVHFAKTQTDLFLERETCNDMEIIHSAHVKDPIMIGKEYTMLYCDTNTDGMKVMAIFEKKRN